MKDRDFLGKKVISMADGAEVGSVKDIVFQGLELTSLLLKGDRGEGLLPFGKIGKNGPDAIMIDSYGVVDWNVGKGLAPENRSSHDLRKLSVIDGDGHVLGHLHDFTMDAKGHVESIAVRTEGIFGIMADETVVEGSRVRAIGADMITVDSPGKA
ncbi:MAG: PRC-barrel domain-containing protein [Armatimonadetes bacterium]|nr:PRC-barrel domain-containing protein [Armatimonadota bacterium]